jgi:DNA-binding GntR family transcriptional regulator
MERGTGEWEAGVVASLHRLKHYVRANPRGLAEGDTGFDALHKAFHTSLLAACGSPRLIAAHSDLYDQAYRYRRLMMAGFTDSEAFLADHDRLADFALRREPEKGGEALAVHIASTLRHVYPTPPETSA